MILITGGAGYIGSHVTRQLAEAGRRVVVLDNLSTGFADALVNREELAEGDLADTQFVENLFRCHRFETIIHFAAAIVAPESVTNPIRYYSNNSRNTLDLLAMAVRHRVKRFIFSSTAAVYGVPDSGVAIETDQLRPINPYGSSKLMSEWMIRDVASAHGIGYVALRYFNVAGADPLARMGQRSLNATHLIKVCCQAALGLRESVAIFGTDYPTHDGTGVRDYIHVEDLAASHLAGLEHLEQGGESLTLNVGYGKGYSVREVIQVVKEVTGVDFSVKEEGRRPGDPPSLIAGADLIREQFGWQPRYDNLKTIVADAWRWEQKLADIERVGK